MAYCTKCGTKNKEKVTFCYQCGNKMDSYEENVQGHAEINKQQLENAMASIAGGIKETIAIPNVEVLASAVLNVLGLIIFLFPWAGAFGFSVSGFSIATNPKFYGSETMLLLIIPIACIVSLVFYYRLHKKQIDIRTVRKIMMICGITALALQTVIYLVVNSKVSGFSVFTSWFYFEFLIWIGIILCMFYSGKREVAIQGSIDK